MYTIALTGGIACGKTTVAAMLQKLGAAVVDADQISRALTAQGGQALPAIYQAFGDEVFQAQARDTLDRAALGRLVFTDDLARQRLNAIMHPLIGQEMQRQKDQCRQRGETIVVLDVPLLFECHMQHMGDIVLCVTVPPEVQITRLMARDGLDREAALARIASQMPLAQKAAMSDESIDTHRPMEEVYRDVCARFARWQAAGKECP